MRAIRKAQDFVSLLGLGGFGLAKSVRNFLEAVAHLNRNAVEEDVKDIASDNETLHILGLRLNHRSDALAVSRRTNQEAKKLIT